MLKAWQRYIFFYGDTIGFMIIFCILHPHKIIITWISVLVIRVKKIGGKEQNQHIILFKYE